MIIFYITKFRLILLGMTVIRKKKIIFDNQFKWSLFDWGEIFYCILSSMCSELSFGRMIIAQIVDLCTLLQCLCCLLNMYIYLFKSDTKLSKPSGILYGKGLFSM